MFLYNKLSVYQKAFALNKRIYQFLKNASAIPPYAKNQLGRSTLSIMLNIAEGSAKISKKDKRNYMIIARASAFESAALIHF
ncbi:MAG: ribosomal protein [Chitinophagaceae bacterium]|nr:ribosomal protein [Chitinophagaceae bacterium]